MSRKKDIAHRRDFIFNPSYKTPRCVLLIFQTSTTKIVNHSLLKVPVKSKHKPKANLSAILATATFFKFELLKHRTTKFTYYQFSSQHHRGYTDLSKSPPSPPAQAGCLGQHPGLVSVPLCSIFSVFAHLGIPGVSVCAYRFLSCHWYH